MSANKAATTAPAIVAARTQIATNQAPPTPAATTATTQQIPLSQKWAQQTGGTLKGLANSLSSMNLIDRGGAMQLGEQEIKKPTTVKLAVAKVKGGTEPKATSSLGTEGSAMYIATQGLNDMFDAAQKAGLRTRDQFRAGFDELINTAGPKAKQLFKDEKFHFMLPNFKDVAAQKFADLNK